MDRTRQQVVILDLLSAMGEAQSWRGETHLQKSLYFLQEGLGVPLELPFVLYKHGPYSFELHDLLGEMKAGLLIDLKAQPYPYGPSLVPTEIGESLVKRFPRMSTSVKNNVEFVSQNLSNKNVGELERLCTALFIAKRELGKSDIDVARQMVAIKPHIKLDEAEDALKRVRHLLDEAKVQ